MTLNTARQKDPSLWVAYDPETGTLTWLASFGKAAAGNPAGTLTTKGYLAVTVLGRRYLAHRLAWLLTYGELPSVQIDHINGVKTDNRLSNLRLATNSQNHGNRGPSRASTSGVKGVYWWKTGRKWKAQLTHQGRSHFIGYFSTKEDAAAHAEAEVRIRGDFAYAASAGRPGPAVKGYLPLPKIKEATDA